MSRFDEAKAKLRGVGGDEKESDALENMRGVWAEKREGGYGGGETPMAEHHKDAKGAGRSVSFQFAEDTKVPGEPAAETGGWGDILEREGKRKGKSLFSFDKDGKPIVNMKIQPPPGH
ncbi:MAG: hypothetical protein ACRDKW_02875 [Actinomycetota bacterium]